MGSDCDIELRAPVVITATSVTTSSSAAVAVHPAGAKGKQRVVFVCDVDCYLKFGDSSVAAATEQDEFVPADEYLPVDTTNSTTHFRVLGADTGTLAHTVQGYQG